MSEALTPDEIRSLLRECVTVVAPGETLVLRFAPGSITDERHATYQRTLMEAAEKGGWPRMVIVQADEMGVAQAGDAAFARRVMDAINLLDVSAVVYNGADGAVAARPRWRGEATGWWPPSEEEATPAPEHPQARIPRA